MTRSELFAVRRAVLTDAAAIAGVHVASWRETYAGVLPARVLDALSVEQRTALWTRILGATDPNASTVLVAESGGTVVAFVSAGPQSAPPLRDQGFAGAIHAIYVRQLAQRGGIGRALLRAAATSLLDREITSASLLVLRENSPARFFYERLGAEKLGEWPDTIDGAPIVEVGYGWRDVTALAAQ